MNVTRKTVALGQLLLISPAALFMAALVVRYLPFAYGAQRIVLLYAHRQWTLWVLLITLPLAVLIAGGAILLRDRLGPVADGRGVGPSSTATTAGQPHAATRMVAVITAAAACFLTVVALHMLAN
jgi:hypothetical protein